MLDGNIIQGVPEILKHFSFCRVAVLWHRLRQTIPQTKENGRKFCIFMRETPRQSGGPRCEPRKNERERARSPSPSLALLRRFSRFPCDLVLQLGQCRGLVTNTSSFEHSQRKKSCAVSRFGLLSHDIYFENKARLPERAGKQSISFL